MFLFPEKTPHISTDAALLAALIFSTLVLLQLGHLIAVCIGLPQLGQLSAESEISLLQSGQVIRGIGGSLGDTQKVLNVYYNFVDGSH